MEGNVLSCGHPSPKLAGNTRHFHERTMLQWSDELKDVLLCPEEQQHMCERECWPHFLLQNNAALGCFAQHGSSEKWFATNLSNRVSWVMCNWLDNVCLRWNNTRSLPCFFKLHNQPKVLDKGARLDQKQGHVTSFWNRQRSCSATSGILWWDWSQLSS